MSTINLGTLNVDQTIPGLNGTINNSNRSDTYRFRLQESMSFNLDLSLIAAGSDLDVVLARDANNNNRIDPGEEIVSSTLGGNNNDFINVRTLESGRYLVNIYRFSGNSSYRLRLSTTGREAGNVGISNLLPQEESFGTLRNNHVTRENYTLDDLDTADVFKFSLDDRRRVTVDLTGLTGDADVRLIRDRNNNRIIDASDFFGSPSGEILGVGFAGGTTDDHIELTLGRGSYFVQVFQFQSSPIEYDLRVGATAV